MKLGIWTAAVIWAGACAFGDDRAASASVYDGSSTVCPEKKQNVVSKRLNELLKADHDDRNAPNSFDSKEAFKIHQRDQERRSEVAVMFAEGCINSGEDYSNAAFLFQHGEHPDHYYQAWLWATKAVQLGVEKGKVLIPLAIDRYLTALGFQQLFGSQGHGEYKSDGSMEWCIWPIHEAFTDEARVKHSGKTLEQTVAPLKAYTGELEFCEMDLEDPPKGIFPGVW